jgi:stress-induced-phosphoprotein 1
MTEPTTAKEWKEKGNGLVKEKKYSEAAECYTKAIELDPNDPILYSNRSAMYTNIKKFDEALKDAEKAIELKPTYGKAYLRKGSALKGLGRIDEALSTFKAGLEKEPENVQLKQAVDEIEAEVNNPFLKNYPKLFTDPRTARYMSDPQFKNLLDYAMKDQKILLQLLQTDPRFMDVFSVLTGIDMTKMNEDALKAQKERKEEEDKYNAMSEEEKKEFDNHKKADKINLKGNEQYKKKNFN